MSAAKRSSSIRWSNAEAENTTRAIRGSLTQSRTSRSSRVSRTSTLKRSKSVRSFWNSGREGGQEPHRADSGTDVEQGPAQHELAAAQAQVTQLSRQLEAESRHANMLDGELGLSLAQLRRQEEAHGIEQSRLEEKNIQGVEQRRSLMEKLKQIETVENAVRELYIQMKDRVAEEAPSAEQLQLELVALGKEDVLVTIGKLHAELKNLWVFKTEAEEDMRVGRLQEQQLNTRNTRVLQQQLLRLGKEVTAAHDAADKAQQRAAEAEESRQAVLDESKDVVADLQTHMQAVVEQLRAAESENASLRRKLTQARDEGRKRDSLVLQNRQLENARHFDRESLNNMLRAQRHDMLRQQSQLLAEISSIPVLQKQIDELQEELRAAKNLIRSLQGSFKASQVLKMERRTAVLEGQNERLCRAKGELQRKVAQQAEAEAALASGKKVLEGQLRSLQQQVEGGRPRSAPGGGRKTQQYRSARSEANGESAGGGSNSARKVRDPSAAGQAGKVLATTDPLLERVRTSLANVRGRLADASLIRATHDARRYEREA